MNPHNTYNHNREAKLYLIMLWFKFILYLYFNFLFFGMVFLYNNELETMGDGEPQTYICFNPVHVDHNYTFTVILCCCE